MCRSDMVREGIYWGSSTSLLPLYQVPRSISTIGDLKTELKEMYLVLKYQTCGDEKESEEEATSDGEK